MKAPPLLSDLRNVFPGIPWVESPLLNEFINDLGLSSDERRVALELHERGYSVIDFPDDLIDERIDRITAFVGSRFDVDFADPRSVKNSENGLRVQDAWVYNEDIRAIAANSAVLGLLQKLYGRPAFPFQTLNFPVGTQQHLHSDAIHFSSVPERFMCGVWLAMEDIGPDAGPLTYLPGSHRWPILNNVMIGRRGFGTTEGLAQAPFEAAWDALVQASKVEQETFLAKKGQALIWAANLLHGGSPQIDPTRTRWSQVTHYYFDNCIYYTPAFSDELLGMLQLREILDVGTEEQKPNLYLGTPIESGADLTDELSFVDRIKMRLKRGGLPSDFNAEAYYRLNPDVALAQLDAGNHYLSHGRSEGRRYRYRTQR